MASQTPTERWSDRTYTPLQGATRTFDVPGYDTSTAAIAAVINNFGVRPGAPHPDDPFMYVTMGGINARNNEGPTTWIVSCNYGYLAQTSGLGQANPLQNPTRWAFTLGLESINVDADASGEPITNSAGTPFDPKETRTINTLQVTATRFYPNFSIALALRYMNRVNASPIQMKSLGTIPKGCIKCQLICPSNEIVLSQPSPIEVVHRFEIRGKMVSGIDSDPGFWLRQLDEGTTGWYLGDDQQFYEEEFSVRDAENVASAYKIKTNKTLLNGTGVPRDPTVKLGRGTAPKTPHATNPEFQLGRNVGISQKPKATYLYFWVEDLVDFGPLIAGL